MRHWRAIVIAAAPALLLASMLVAAGAIIVGSLEEPARSAWWQQIEPLLPPVLLAWMGLSLAAGFLAHGAWQRYAAPMGRLAEEVQALHAGDVNRALPVSGSTAAKALSTAVNALVNQRTTMRAEFDAKVQEAAHNVSEERERLAALMSELTQSVVVCNLDGRILLYNNRARLQFRALSDAPAVAGGAELIGLGRSIYGVLDRRMFAHALEALRQRMARGAAHPQTQFVTSTKTGQLLRIQLAPVRAPDAAAGPPSRIAGFVLVLDNITREFADEMERDRMLHALTEASRASLGNLQAAVEILDDAGLDTDTRASFQAVVRDEVGAMSQRIRDLATHTTQTMKTRWPLEPMLGAELVEAAIRRIESTNANRASTDDVDASLWLNVDSFSVVEVLTALAQRLKEDHDVELVQLRLSIDDKTAQRPRARLDLMWTGRAMSTETVIGWETDTLRIGQESIPVTVRDVVDRHGGAFWFERERVRQAAFFRFLLPLADVVEEPAPETASTSTHESRPEYYDFDLFKVTEQTHALADRRLAELSYTIFDTETTGLQPSQGDEIIQIGATRIVGGKLRRQEVFEQLVDPRRNLPEAGIAIHGITPPMLENQPTIDKVLPAFHAFAEDTVLVAHNAAFDMRFLQLKEASTGIRFEHPVLDTLLLSPIIHPQQETHKLEAIAERLGVNVLGRHTALGDAMVTAEVFLKMVPLLEAQGIVTLGQALEAARKSMYARVQY
jgi:DNA polymerase III subunit epsilon